MKNDTDLGFVAFLFLMLIVFVIYVFVGRNNTDIAYNNICNSLNLGDLVDTEFFGIIRGRIDNGTKLECEKAFIINNEICLEDKWGNILDSDEDCKTNFVIMKVK